MARLRVSAVALIAGLDLRALGAAWLVIAIVASVIFASGYPRTLKASGDHEAPRIDRIIVGSAVYLAEVVGAALLVCGVQPGLYVAAGALVARFALMISGAWLLVLGTRASSR